MLLLHLQILFKMPPKRKGGASKGAAAAKKSKKAEAGEPSQPATIKDAVAALKSADAKKAKVAAKVDQHCPLGAASVSDLWKLQLHTAIDLYTCRRSGPPFYTHCEVYYIVVGR